MLQQVKPGGFVFITDEPQPQEPCAEGVFFIRTLCLLTAGTSLVEGLCGDRKAELNVCLDLAGVSSAVKQPEFNGTFLENRVKV